MNHPEPPPIPPLSGRMWLLAALFFPMGTFLALAGARVLQWHRAIIYAFLSAIPMAAFTWLFLLYMNQLDVAGALIQGALSVALLLYCFLVGWLQYRLGQRAAAWTVKARKIWKGAFITGIVLLILTPFTTALSIIMMKVLNEMQTRMLY
jgi:hypothetical protein